MLPASSPSRAAPAPSSPPPTSTRPPRSCPPRSSPTPPAPTPPATPTTPMPGKVSGVNVTKGQTIKAGERLLSIEAMKMETALYSPRDAKVADILVKPGSIVAAQDLLVVLE